MKIEGEYTFDAPRDRVWDLLQRSEALSHALPGVEEFRQVGPDEYEATVKVGVAAIRGTYHGRVKMVDLEPPVSYTLIGSGQGGSGTIQATARIQLVGQESRTTVHYAADAQVGGTIAGVGQRMLGGVANLMAKQFFKAIEGQMTGHGAVAAPIPAASAHRTALPATSRASTGEALELLGLAGFITPVIATMLAGAVGFMVGRRARRRAGSRPASAGSANRELAVAIHDLANAVRENRQRWAHRLK